ncbi:unnamed protein product [Effrenium voratum]|nr:unnamed protein product [Effrenium voratum]|mmetsp:Transcript_99837/g.237951  ORF Transcript_99837/g.237951 Transcript_99837/m.237951 type:complete len:220 (-) Transcript_99837:58-717(-)
MSLGWLTESSLIPKESKPIGGVSTVSLLNLQAVVYDREQRGNVPSAKRRKAAAEAKAKNDGVDMRNARDQREAEDKSDLVRARLEEKARRYEAMAAGGASAEKEEPLIDFDRKRAEGLLPPAAPQVDETAEEAFAPWSVEVPPPPGLATGTVMPVPMQPFERPRSSAEDLDLRDRLTAETDLARGTLGQQKRAAREAVRGRLAKLRAAKSMSEASASEA